MISVAPFAIVEVPTGMLAPPFAMEPLSPTAVTLLSTSLRSVRPGGRLVTSSGSLKIWPTRTGPLGSTGWVKMRARSERAPDVGTAQSMICWTNGSRIRDERAISGPSCSATDQSSRFLRRVGVSRMSL